MNHSTVLQLALDALEYHRDQTRAIPQSDDAIDALRTTIAESTRSVMRKAVNEFLEKAPALAAPAPEIQAPAVGPVAIAYMAFCGDVALTGYAGVTEHEVKHKVLDEARHQGLQRDGISGRLPKLGWHIEPIYAAPQPAAPVTDAEVEAALRKWQVGYTPSFTNNLDMRVVLEGFLASREQA